MGVRVSQGQWWWWGAGGREGRGGHQREGVSEGTRKGREGEGGRKCARVGGKEGGTPFILPTFFFPWLYHHHLRVSSLSPCEPHPIILAVTGEASGSASACLPVCFIARPSWQVRARARQDHIKSCASKVTLCAAAGEKGKGESGSRTTRKGCGRERSERKGGGGKGG